MKKSQAIAMVAGKIGKIIDVDDRDAVDIAIEVIEACDDMDMLKEFEQEDLPPISGAV